MECSKILPLLPPLEISLRNTMFAKAHGRNHDQDIITDRSEVGIPRVVEGHERMGKTIEPVILTMAGGRFSV